MILFFPFYDMYGALKQTYPDFIIKAELTVLE